MTEEHQLVYDSIIESGYRDKNAVFIFQMNGGFKKRYKATTLFDKVSDLEKEALSYLRKGNSVLDVGAVAGRICLFLLKNVFCVNALEKSKTICRVLKKRGVKKIINTDIFKYSPKIKYDVVLLINDYSILGKTKGNIIKLFRLFRKKVLKSNGEIIFVSSLIGSKITRTIKRRFIFKDRVGLWFESSCLSMEDIIKIAKKSGLTTKEFKKDKTGEFFTIFKK